MFGNTASVSRSISRGLSLVSKKNFATTQLQAIGTAQDGYVLENSINKVTMPAFGFGTWGCGHFDHDTIAKAVDQALKVGYRHFDCARVYDNEKEIGNVFKDAIANGLCKREDLFIVSKLFNQEHNKVEEVLDDTLKNLGMDYVDAFLVHWPFHSDTPSDPWASIPFKHQDLAGTLEAIYKCEKEGKTKSTGLCNATVKKLSDMKQFLTDKGAEFTSPAIHQVELHPYLQQPELIDYCNKNNIIVTAAMPLGSPERPVRCRRDDDPVILENPAIKEIADQAGCSPAQVIIRWHLQRGIVVIPKATEDWMIQQNFDTLKLTLTDEQMNEITKLDKHMRFSRAEFLAWKENQPWEELWDNE